MNIPPNDLKPALQSRDGAEDRMEQIRELLVGEHLRIQEARLAAVESRLRDLEGLVFRRVDALTARIEALAADTGSDRRAAFDELSRMVLDLSENIHRLSRG
ncbi:MAG: hypothetical protein B7Y80_07760 [Hyphomicrobium sp. 32-62-53]|nr:MAG: hypothetical protein B7Z29_03765 [Hyphomicrobium sp. 12-62-95]OYY00496.1 MAG: hypothetical protein B7Y80_07760 [Hyphomicrobium sp. 32-62-53]